MKRRKLLTGAALLGMGAGVVGFRLSGDDEFPDRKRSIQELEKLSKEADKTDISSPTETFAISNNITRVTASVEVNLNSEPANDSQTETIQSALRYYEALARYLSEGNRISEELEQVENNLTLTSEQPDPLYETWLEELESELFNFEQIDKELNRDDELLSRILPNRDSTIDQARRLKNVYEGITAAQKGIIRANEDIGEGALHRESGDVGAARDLFDAAISQSTFDVESEAQDYSLHDNYLSLSEYADILDEYRAGAVAMKESCGDLHDERLNARFGTGLESVFRARERIEHAV